MKIKDKERKPERFKVAKEGGALTWWYVGAEPSAGDHDVCLIGSIKRLACTAIYSTLNKTQ